MKFEFNKREPMNRRTSHHDPLPLNAMEEKRLREKLKTPSFFLVIAVVFFSIIYTFLPNDQTVLIFFWVFCLLFLGILTWLIGGFLLDLKNGVKSIIRGKVDDRITNYFKSGKRAHSVLIIDGRKVKVEPAHFDSVRTGDQVEVHWAPRSGTSFQVSALQGTSGRVGSIGLHNQRALRFKDTESIKEVLTAQDKKVLWKTLRSKVLLPVLALLFMSYLVIGLISSGSGGLLIFLFPIPILFIFLVVKITKMVQKCSRESKIGHKMITKTMLIDKYQYHRSARGGTRYMLKTLSAETIANKKLYHKLNPNESISISISSESQQLLGITLASGEYVIND